MKSCSIKHLLPWVVLLLFVQPLWAAEVAGGKSRVVQIGDKCTVDFSCRLKDGRVIATTLPSVARDPKVPKSDLFLDLQDYRSTTLMAGMDSVTADPQSANMLLGRLDKKLSEAIVGLETGKPAQLTLTSEAMAMPDGSDGLVRFNIVRVRQIERTLSMKMFKGFSKGKEPAVGMEIQLEPPGAKWGEPGGLMGRVTAIEGDKVKVQSLAKPGDTLQTLYGPAKVERYRDDNFMEIRLQPEVGRLVRYGHMFGRVSKVESEIFIVDMNNPFGGETLACETLVSAADPDSPEKRELMARMRGEMEQSMERQMAAARAQAEGEKADVIQAGDLLQAQYKIVDPQGKTWFSLFPEDAAAMARKNAAGNEPDVLPPYYPVVAGRPSDVPGLDLAVIGMRKGERKKVSLPPEKGFGQRDPKLVVAFERSRQVPLQNTLERAQFEQQFRTSPKVGDLVDMLPFGRARILQATAQEVTLELQPENKKQEQPFGTGVVTVDQGNAVYTLTPRIGAAYPFEGKTGTIVTSDEKNFSVDFNHPLAEKSITLEIAVQDFRKASAVGKPLHWVEDLKEAAGIAQREDKPVAVVLYADWCSWCKRLFGETLADPVITAMGDQFVWVKLNSDKQQEYKARFGQQGFPMMVVLDKKGQVIEKREGFQQVYPLWKSLWRVLEGQNS